MLLGCQSNGIVSHFNTSRGQLISSFQVTQKESDYDSDDTAKPTEIYCCKYNQDGSGFALGGKDGSIRLYDEYTQKIMLRLKDGDGKTCVGHSNRVFSVIYSDTDLNILYSGGWDHTVQIWDQRVGHAVQSIHECHIYGDSLDIRNQVLMVGNYDVEN